MLMLLLYRNLGQELLLKNIAEKVKKERKTHLYNISSEHLSPLDSKQVEKPVCIYI